MRKKEEKYYGIRFNNDIPKTDKINSYNKEVEITFLGRAYLVERKDDDTIEKTEIENYYKLEKEGKYEIEFINKQNKVYNLQIEISKSFLLFILLFLLGILLFSLLFKPVGMDQSLFGKFLSVIDFSVISVDINEEAQPDIKYVFDVGFKNLVSKEATLSNSMNAKGVAKNKIAPGVNGEFSIIISTRGSNVDMKYSVDFQDITKDKPNNLIYNIKGQTKRYSTLQELENELKGTMKKGTEKEFIIEWEWAYETDNSQDLVDTNDGIKLNNYKFKINVNGEEAIN